MTNGGRSSFQRTAQERSGRIFQRANSLNSPENVFITKYFHFDVDQNGKNQKIISLNPYKKILGAKANGKPLRKHMESKGIKFFALPKSAVWNTTFGNSFLRKKNVHHGVILTFAFYSKTPLLLRDFMVKN